MSTYYHLDYRDIVKISGADSEKFLQNLISNDINKLEKEEILYSLLLSPQGKVLYDFFIFKVTDDFYLDCHRKYTTEIVQKFNMYKLHSKIEIAAQSNSEVYISNTKLTHHCYKDPRDSRLGFRGYSLNPKELEGFELDEVVLDQYKQKRYDLFIPEFGDDFGPGEFFALRIEMDRLNALSFNKGCYVGQEVTARMNYRGKRKESRAIEAMPNFQKYQK
jgi:folate-binding protein YgfZ